MHMKLPVLVATQYRTGITSQPSNKVDRAQLWLQSNHLLSASSSTKQEQPAEQENIAIQYIKDVSAINVERNQEATQLRNVNLSLILTAENCCTLREKKKSRQQMSFVTLKEILMKRKIRKCRFSKSYYFRLRILTFHVEYLSQPTNE